MATAYMVIAKASWREMARGKTPIQMVMTGIMAKKGVDMLRGNEWVLV